MSLSFVSISLLFIFASTQPQIELELAMSIFWLDISSKQYTCQATILLGKTLTMSTATDHILLYWPESAAKVYGYLKNVASSHRTPQKKNKVRVFQSS